MPDDLTHMYSNIYCSPTSETNLPSMWKMQRTCHYWIASSLTILNKPALLSSRLKKNHLDCLDSKKIRGFFLWGSLKASELSSESLELAVLAADDWRLLRPQGRWLSHVLGMSVLCFANFTADLGIGGFWILHDFAVFSTHGRTQICWFHLAFKRWEAEVQSTGNDLWKIFKDFEAWRPVINPSRIMSSGPSLILLDDVGRCTPGTLPKVERQHLWVSLDISLLSQFAGCLITSDNIW